MRLLRTFGYLIGPWLAPLLLPPLLVAWLVLAAVVSVWSAWRRAA